MMILFYSGHVNKVPKPEEQGMTLDQLMLNLEDILWGLADRYKIGCYRATREDFIIETMERMKCEIIRYEVHK